MKIFATFILVISYFTAFTKTYNVLDFGAKGLDTQLETTFIQNAINQCAAEGGGTVLVPKGIYLVGTLNLKSNIQFHLEHGAVLKASTNLAHFQRHNEQLAGLFYTEDAHDVSITGSGELFGQGMLFMEQHAKTISGEVTNHIRQKENFRKVTNGIGDGPLWPKDRYHQMVVFSNCTDVELSDFKCVDAPYWTILMVHCNKVKISKVQINNNLLIPNSDGLDIVSCSNVNVSDCIFICGDDAIVLAGYAHHFGDPGFKGILKPSQNINVTNCTFQSRSSAIRIGGWDQNHMLNYNFSNITIFDSNCGINLTVRDSGSIQNVNFSNIVIETRMHTGDWWGNGEPIKISALRGVPSNPIGVIKNIKFNNVTTVGENSILIYASHEADINGIYFNNFNFKIRKSALENVSGGNFDLRPNTVKGKEIYQSNVPIVYIEHAKNVIFNNGDLLWDNNISADYFTYALEAHQVDRLLIDNVFAQPAPSNKQFSPIKVEKCQNVRIE